MNTHDIFDFLSKKVGGGHFLCRPHRAEKWGGRIPPVPHRSMPMYSGVSGPLDRSERFTLCSSPGRPVHSDTNSASPGSIVATLQLPAKTKSLTFPPLSIAKYSVLARIDKFSNLPVINFFFTVIKTKDQLFVRGIWGDEMREKARKSAV